MILILVVTCKGVKAEEAELFGLVLFRQNRLVQCFWPLRAGETTEENPSRTSKIISVMVMRGEQPCRPPKAIAGKAAERISRKFCERGDEKTNFENEFFQKNNKNETDLGSVYTAWLWTGVARSPLWCGFSTCSKGMSFPVKFSVEFFHQ